MVRGRGRSFLISTLIRPGRAVMTAMRAGNYGRIVNVASIAGIGTALPGNAFYAATKSAVMILTRRFAFVSVVVMRPCSNSAVARLASMSRSCAGPPPRRGPLVGVGIVVLL